MIVKFRVQHEILSGLRYEQTAKRDGGNIIMKLFKPPPIKEMMGSYAPNTKQKPYYEVKLPPMEAPDMKAAKAKYKAQSKFTDDDGQVHMKFDWVFEIADNW
jgi:Rho GDP-dissociation inhibitor